MVRRFLLIGLLALSLTALMGREASARICVAKVGGYCTLWVGSIECGIGATGLGNVLNDPVTLGCTATGTDNWVVACGNPGSNTWTSPGINVIQFDGTLAEAYVVEPGDVDRNGNAFVTVIARPPAGLLSELVSKGACPNNNWVAIDAAPCSLTLRDVQLDVNNLVKAEAYYQCVLPECATVQWDVATQRFERRQYECVQTSTRTYKDPIPYTP